MNIILLRDQMRRQAILNKMQPSVREPVAIVPTLDGIVDKIRETDPRKKKKTPHDNAVDMGISMINKRGDYIKLIESLI